MFGLQELLLNFLFLIIFLLFIPIFIKLNYRKISRFWLYNLSNSIAILSCISFPIPIMEGYIWDLRLVVLTFGGLYGGIQSILLLGGVTVILRLIIGGPGAIVTLIVIAIFICLLITMSHIFINSSRSKKVILGTTLSSSAAVLAILNSTLIFNVPFSVLFLFAYIIVTVTSTAVLIYLYEIFQESILISKRVLRAEKLEVVSYLASSVSHEVKNPLTVVKGFLQLMIQTDLPQNKRTEYLKISIGEIDRANELIRDYLTFAKPSPANERILNIKEEIQRTLNVIRPLANMKSVEIETEVMDFYFKGEEQPFQQCLLNIIKNSIEAVQNTGHIKISTQRCSNNLKLIIADNGKGMNKEQISRLGEAFFTTKGREGTGLGMMVAINVIESMNGNLRVKSELNKGTIFYISLPLLEKT
ncbi:ATP-binding protein [Niallia taxi]|uniref:ATP-binding protein n=1 Tax=Niallia taxi TaxID=2499688 RepID=UPI003981FEF1